MDYQISYFKDKQRKGKPVKKDVVSKIGNWRSRWERKRDLAKNNPKQDQITRIFTKGTEKDYIVTEVHGVSPSNLYFRAVPIEKKKSKANEIKIFAKMKIG